MSKQLQKRLEAERARMEKKYGEMAADLASTEHEVTPISTGILALDYATGIGGIPTRFPIEVFGPPDIGKSSIVGLGVMRSAAKLGKTCGIVALEPGIDAKWLRKHGIDPDYVLIGRPDDGKEAFDMCHEWLHGDLIDVVLFDSIGQMLRESEAQIDGRPSQGGQAGLITWGVKSSVMPCFKNDKGLIFINQVRDDMKAMHAGVVDSPGGWALKHACTMRIQLKGGTAAKDKYKVKLPGEEEPIIIGRRITAVIRRNKHAEGSERTARFDFYQKQAEGYPFGIDVPTDVLDTGMMTGVIHKDGSMYSHESFPKPLRGKETVNTYLDEHPEAYEAIRRDVLAVMRSSVQLNPLTAEEEEEQ